MLNKRWTMRNLHRVFGNSVSLSGFGKYGYQLNSEWVKRDGVRCKEYWLSYTGIKKDE